MVTKSVFYSLIFLLLLMASSFNNKQMGYDEECTVIEIYEAIEVDYGVKVLTNWDNLEHAKLILIPTEIEIGTYDLQISYIADNLYKITGTDYYLETMICLEIGFFSNAILVIENNYSPIKGLLYFY